jgi:hypothetical protein
MLVHEIKKCWDFLNFIDVHPGNTLSLGYQIRHKAGPSPEPPLQLRYKEVNDERVFSAEKIVYEMTFACSTCASEKKTVR